MFSSSEGTRRAGRWSSCAAGVTHRVRARERARERERERPPGTEQRLPQDTACTAATRSAHTRAALDVSTYLTAWDSLLLGHSAASKIKLLSSRNQRVFPRFSPRTLWLSVRSTFRLRLRSVTERIDLRTNGAGCDIRVAVGQRNGLFAC